MLDAPADILAFLREGGGERILCVFNFGSGPAEFAVPAGLKVTALAGHGFTGKGVEPWLPFGTGLDVESQRGDPESVLTLCRDLLTARREREELRTGSYATLPSPEGVWAWQRGDGHAVAMNLSESEATVGVTGTIVIGTDRGRDGEAVAGRLVLRPFEGALLET